MQPFIWLRISNVVSYALFVFPGLTTVIKGPSNIREMSGNYETPLTPPGWAFAIWGVIFSLQLAASLHQLLPSEYQESSWKRHVVGNRIGVLWQCCWLLECLWQLLFVYNQRWSMWVCLLLLWGSLGFITAARIRLVPVTASLHAEALQQHSNAPTGPFRHIQLRLPWAYYPYLWGTSINAAWLAVASAIGIFVTMSFEGLPPAHLLPMAVMWGVKLGVSGCFMVLRNGDFAYGLAIVWAFSALASKSIIPTLIRVVAGVVVLLQLSTLAWVAARGPSPGEMHWWGGLKAGQPEKAGGTLDGFGGMGKGEAGVVGAKGSTGEDSHSLLLPGGLVSSSSSSSQSSTTK
ncbi:MAG: hypothetical protein WDW38_003358 [Sanguina aurantia]